MKEGVGRLLLTSELTTDAADRRTAFLIDAGHALTAWHCARDSREGADPLWLRLRHPDVHGAWVDLPMRVADHDTALDAAVLRLDPDRPVRGGDGIDLPQWLAGAALVLGTAAVAHAPVRTEGFPRRKAPAGLAFSGTVTDPTARLRSGVTVLQLHLDELGAGVPQGPGEHSGGPALCSEAGSGGEVVVGLVRAFPADESGQLAVGGTVLATRVQDLAVRFPLVSDVVTRRDIVARRARDTLQLAPTGVVLAVVLLTIIVLVFYRIVNNTSTVTIPVGQGPKDVALAPDGSHAYIANNGSDSVSVIDTTKNTVTATITVGQDPSGVALAPDGRHAYITNIGSDSVSVIDTTKNTVTATITVGKDPHDVALAPDGNHAYITNNGSDSVSVIDTTKNTVTIPVGQVPQGVALARDGSHVYIANGGSDSVSVIDTTKNTVTAIIPVGKDPVGVALAPDGRHAYITNNGSDSVSVIDTEW